jgi:small subunit ribosomal protein S3
MASERKFIAEKVRRVLLKEFVQARVTRAGFGGLDVQRTPMGTRVTLITERPGLVIGRRGEAIKSLTKAIEEDFKFNNPQIEVQEVENPNLNAQIMAEKLANALERGWHFRRAGHSTVRRIMESGAKGCQVVISGKLTGQRHRTEKFKDGHIKYCGQAKLDFMQNGFATAKLKPGVIGITVRIMDPNARLPDEIDIIPPKLDEAPAAPAAPALDAKEEKKVDEAVQELKKAADEGKAEEKPKRRKKKEGEAPAAADGEEKKPKRRKKKDEGETKPDEAPAKAEQKAEKAPEPPAPEPAPETKEA